MNDSELIDELTSITEKLGGTIERRTTFNSSGRESKKIIIEYDVKTK